MGKFESIDYFSNLDLIEDPHPFFRHLRESGSVVELPTHGLIAVAGWQEGADLLGDAKTFSSVNTATGPIPPLPFEPEGDDIMPQIEAHRSTMPYGAMLVAQDGNEHKKARRLLNGLLTPKRFRENEEYLTDLADRMIDGFIDKGGIEVISEYAHPYATLALADLLGMPEQACEAALAGCGNLPGHIGMVEAEKTNPLETLAMHFYGFIAERRQAPKNDVMTILAEANHADGSLPSIEEVVSFAAVLFGAGQDTTVRLIAATLKTLGERPALQEDIRANPGLVPAFIEEVLRLDGPAKSFFRLATRPAKVGDVDVAPGTTIMISPAAMNRDPRKFENPDDFRLDRANVRDHMSFGRGAHACLGAPLARAEARLTIEKLLSRVKGIRIDESVHGPEGARRYDYEPNYTQRALRTLNITFEKA